VARRRHRAGDSSLPVPRPRSWSDDDLRTALAGATSLAQVVERLRLRKGGASYTTVRTRLEQLGLEPPAPTRPTNARGPAWRRGFTEDALRRAVERADDLKGVFDRLGLAVGGSQWVTVRSLIVERGWSTDHWRRPLGNSTPDVTTSAQLRAALERADLADLVARSRNRADVIRALGGTPNSSTYRLLRRALSEQPLDTSHFETPHQRMCETPPRPPRPLEEVLTRDVHVNTNQLKQRLLAEGVFQHRCAGCGGRRWRGGPIPLQLDHIDGDRTNNELSNLRLLCPNCHALTDTYCGRNIGRR
jgi:hypothetical protein